jgi:hypothetical protein
MEDRVKLTIYYAVCAICVAGVFERHLSRVGTRTHAPLEATTTTRRVMTSMAAETRRDVPSHPLASRDEVSRPHAALPSKVLAAYGKVPMRFERNQGQTNDDAKFVSRGHGYTVFLTPTEAVMALSHPAAPVTSLDGGRAPQKMATTVRMTLVGANRAQQIDGRREATGEKSLLCWQRAGTIR